MKISVKNFSFRIDAKLIMIFYWHSWRSFFGNDVYLVFLLGLLCKPLNIDYIRRYVFIRWINRNGVRHNRCKRTSICTRLSICNFTWRFRPFLFYSMRSLRCYRNLIWNNYVRWSEIHLILIIKAIWTMMRSTQFIA